MDAAIRANAPALLAYLERRLPVREDAADVLGDALVTAWRRAGALPEDPERARMWLFVVTRNTLANHERGARRRAASAQRLRELLAAAPPAAPGAETDPDVLAVRDALLALPPRERELVTLVHWDGFSLAEVAELLGEPATTVRSRYAATKRGLRAALATTDPSPAPDACPATRGA